MNEKSFIEEIRKEFLTDEEREKVIELGDEFSRAYLKVWFGRIFGNHLALTETLKDVKRKIEEVIGSSYV